MQRNLAALDFVFEFLPVLLVVDLPGDGDLHGGSTGPFDPLGNFLKRLIDTGTVFDNLADLNAVDANDVIAGAQTGLGRRRLGDGLEDDDVGLVVHADMDADALELALGILTHGLEALRGNVAAVAVE